MNEDKLNNIIAHNIKKYRVINSKMTQTNLARAIKVPVKIIKDIERGKSTNKIDICILYKISIVLNIPINRFFEEYDK